MSAKRNTPKSPDSPKIRHTKAPASPEPYLAFCTNRTTAATISARDRHIDIIANIPKTNNMPPIATRLINAKIISSECFISSTVYHTSAIKSISFDKIFPSAEKLTKISLNHANSVI